MMEVLDCFAFTCLAGAAIGFIFLVLGGIFELIDYLTEGRFKNCIVNFFLEESDK